MALPVRTYGDGILIITGDYVRGDDGVSGGSGSTLNLRGGDGDGVGNAGGVLINGGVSGAGVGADGGNVTIVATNASAAGSGTAGSIILTPGQEPISGELGLVKITQSGLELIETSAVPGPTISSTQGRIWLKSEAPSPNVLMFTDGAGTDWPLNGSGSANSLAEVLAVGNTTGGTDLEISTGDELISEAGTSLRIRPGNSQTSFVNTDPVLFIGSGGGSPQVVLRKLDGDTTSVFSWRVGGTSSGNRWIWQFENDENLNFLRRDNVGAAVDTPLAFNWADGYLKTDTSLVIKERADHIATPSSTFGEIWVRSEAPSPNVLMYTDGDGTDWVLNSSGGGTWAASLAAGATSGGTSPIISVGDNIIGVDTAGSDAGDYTVRAGNHTDATGSFTGGDLTISGGSNASSSNGARGGHVVVAGGDNSVASGATGGDLTCRAGAGGIGGAAIFAGGEGLAASAGGAATFQGGDNTDTGRGGNVTVRGGDCVGGSGNDAGGTLTLRGGDARGSGGAADVTIQAGQPGGASGGATGSIDINTSVTVTDTNRQTGSITVQTGNASTASSIGESGALNLKTGTATNASGGISGTITMSTGNANTDSGDITILTGDSTDGDSGTITIQTGDTASNDASDPAGDILLITGSQTDTGSDVNSRAGNITCTLGSSANPNTTGPGGSFEVTAGASTAASANGRGGSISLTAGAYSGGTASGLAGSVTISGGSSTGAAGDGGGITITGGAASGGNSTPGDISITGGAGDAGASNSRGGDVTITAGAGGSSGRGGNLALSAGAAGSSNSNGGSVTITATAPSGVGSDVGISLQATRTGTDDDATVSIDTENGSFAGSEWHHMTVGSVQTAGAGLQTVLQIAGPSTNGQNLKLRVWATAQQVTTTADMMSQIIETAFLRTGGSTIQLTDHVNDRKTYPLGSIPAAVQVTISISGSNIRVQVTGDTVEDTRWMLEVDWQRGGMAA